MCGHAFVSTGATAAHMKAVHKILGPRAKPFEESKVGWCVQTAILAPCVRGCPLLKVFGFVQLINTNNCFQIFILLDRSSYQFLI